MSRRVIKPVARDSEEDIAWQTRLIIRQTFTRCFQAHYEEAFEQSTTFEQAFFIAWEEALKDTIEASFYT